MKPLCYCLYAGLHGWEEGFVSEGYRCIGFDIEDMCALLGQPRPDDCELVLRDVRSIHGAELKDADCIVGSSPCQEFSYRAMPWSRAKALPPPYLGMELFNAQFRIQREASEAAGRYIPMVVENVRGAQKWVGRAKWHFGSYYLWGDVPALMPMTMARKLSGFRFDGSGKSFQTASVEQTGYKTAGMNWSDPTLRGQDFTRIAGNQLLAQMGVKEDATSPTGLAWDDSRKTPPIPPHSREDFGWNHSVELREGRKTVGHANIRDGHTHTRHLTNQRESDAVRVAAKDDEAGSKMGGDWFSDPTSTCRRHGSKSKGRKAASAMIAKIPFALAQHIAKTMKATQDGAAAREGNGK